MSKETLSLVIKDNPEPVIDTDSLTYYLLGADFLWRGGQRFAKHLDLGIYTPVLQEFYSDSNIVDVFDEKRKAQLLSHDFGDTTSDTQFVQARKTIKEAAMELASLQGEGEKSLCFYYDLSNDQIKSLKSEPGEYTSTPAAIFPVLRMDNCIPLIEVHKHPKNSFLSAQDFHPILTELWEKGPSLARTIMIICPDIQVLALATVQTPLMPQEEAGKLFRPVDANLMEGREAEHKKNMARVHRLIREKSNFLTRSLKRFMAEVAPLEDDMKKQGATNEEIVLVMKQIANRYQLQNDQYYARNDRAMDKAMQQLMSLANQTTEKHLISFARSINVVLYNSYNFRDFHQFSA